MAIKVIVPSASRWWKLGAASGASGVVLCSFGAHGLKERVSNLKLLKYWETAAHYQLVHSAVLLAVPMCKRPVLAGGLLATETVLFLGSLYALALTEQRKLGMITPVGAPAIVAGWLALKL